MKNTIKFLFGAVFATGMFLASCSDDDNSLVNNPGGPDLGEGIIVSPNQSATNPSFMTDVTVKGMAYKRISGDINVDFTMEESVDYIISGAVNVLSGNTLTIEAGTEIYGAPNVDAGVISYFSFDQGSKIMAEGTAAKPIVFTSLNEVRTTADSAPGDWGGIFIHGNASINTGTTNTSEIANRSYGGTDDADNSGVIKYVRVEYSGAKNSADDEANGFMFCGVGSGTTVEYVQSLKGSDDGIEFFGGTVNLKYAVVANVEDDGIDWVEGWRGKVQYAVVIVGEDSDHGFEGDNLNSDNLASPFSQPQFSNVTIVGEGGDRAMLLRRGTKGNFHNVIISGSFSDGGIALTEQQTIDNVSTGDLVFANSINTSETAAYSYDPVSPTANEFSMVASNSTAGVTLTSTYRGTATDNSVDPKVALDSWFDSAVYIGAVDPSSDWTSDWTNF